MLEHKITHQLNHNTYHINQYTYTMIFLGSILGIFLNLIFSFYLDCYIFDFDIEEYHLKGFTIDLSSRYVFYLLKRRIVQLISFLLIGVLFSFKYAAIIYNFIFGTFYGIYFVSMFIKFGIWGIGFTIFSFFPHYIFYFLMIFYITKLYDKTKYEKLTQKNIKFFISIFHFFVIFILFSIGIYIEIKFQKNILNYFYQHIV